MEPKNYKEARAGFLLTKGRFGWHIINLRYVYHNKLKIRQSKLYVEIWLFRDHPKINLVTEIKTCIEPGKNIFCCVLK